MTNTALVHLMQTCNHLLVFTGAGVSTGSGIPDFRGPQGVWKTFQPVYYQDFMTDHAARVEYWSQKLHAFEAFSKARPNAAHRAVAELHAAGKLERCVTQNIDGLHQAAGLPREALVEVHGTATEVECQTCKARSAPAPHFEAFARTRTPPVCACGGWLKSATVSFGQALREEDLLNAYEAAQRCDLCVALGSTLSVHPAASIPLATAKRGVPYVIVNQGPTDQDGEACVTLRLEGDVGTIWPEAVRQALE
ncbi:MAG: NAD-dependent deacetylase [Planctomycetota bacterium]